MKISPQRISIPSFLKVRPGALNLVGGELERSGLSSPSIFFGNGLIEMFGETIFKSLEEKEIKSLHNMELDTTDFEEVTKLAFSLPSNMDCVIGIGGGKVIDVAKYIGFLRNIPFISIPTSSSSDGFSSSSVSLNIKGKKTTLPARLAYGIIIDTEVIKTAPEKFIYSGIGDMISKITALEDWKYEVDHGVGEIDDFAYMISKKSVNSFVRTPFKSITDGVFLNELVNSLAMSGIANEMAGSSLPVSGSEHLISHALDKILQTPQLHGVQVGIATYIMSKVQEHRSERVTKVLTETGFFDYVKTLEMKKGDFEKAIELAKEVKPNRHTYLHDKQNIEKAIEILMRDELLQGILSKY